ncbi:hypothetical protein Bca4012_036443 [Brassica carinata]
MLEPLQLRLGSGGGLGGAARLKSGGRRKGRFLGLDLDAGSGFPIFKSQVLPPRRRHVTQWVTSYTTNLPLCVRLCQKRRSGAKFWG